ncbi:hypothetical protein J7E73_08800 [Paenibacillus albidus]|uniref:TetR/AcrR family transcriptional regulator n=1 Tax=Paenibacillus albidus TaxID=2041023 RepID=UPI001BEA140E|nr:TetR/AcrR family transcriptional regulator [Paenibacillus albidus]MBT2289229.1 hypothetical protein [Paenibacillus albidus]
MRDIIRHTKLSIGSVYRYFTDIDDILIHLSNRNQDQFKLWEKCEPLFTADQSVSEVILSIFHHLGVYYAETIPTDGKIGFEINTKFLTDPAGYEKRRQQFTEVQDFQKLMHGRNGKRSDSDQVLSGLRGDRSALR